MSIIGIYEMIMVLTYTVGRVVSFGAVGAVAIYELLGNILG